MAVRILGSGISRSSGAAASVVAAVSYGVNGLTNAGKLYQVALDITAGGVITMNNEKTRIGALTASRVAEGVYRLRSAGAFASTYRYKANLRIAQVGNECLADVQYLSVNDIEITVRDFAGNLVDGAEALLIDIEY